MATKILFCDCVHEFQDEKYGKHQRLHNSTLDDKKRPPWRCTVCKKEKA